MPLEYEFGQNVLKKVFSRAFEELKCDTLDCMAFNINLDYVLSLYEQYPLLKSVNLYSNSEFACSYSIKNKGEIVNLFKKNSIKFHHISKNSNIVHAKIYRFWKNEKIAFGCVGSPNLTNESNQNFECLIYIFDDQLNEKIWNDFSEICELYGIRKCESVPSCILSKEERERDIDEKYMEGLWEHQKAILKWLVKRYRAIVNIPTGTGKTKIALSYLNFLFDEEEDITPIILVPTTALLEQWMETLSLEGINCYEMGTDLSGLDEYFGDPSGKAVVTLYSRFFNNYSPFIEQLRIIHPNIILIADECHNLYLSLDSFNKLLTKLIHNFGKNYILALSATIDTFNESLMKKFIDLMGGEDNRFIITLQGYYSNWNDKNKTPTLKPIKYTPIFYNLTREEMEKYNKFTRNVVIEQSRRSVLGEQTYSAAIKRAKWVRELKGGVEKLKEHIRSHIGEINTTNTLIFVQTNQIAEKLRDFIVKQPGWEGSAYVYDSSKAEKYREYAMEQFKKNRGFCLFSEQMLSEGYDLPKISRVTLHGSQRSQRDWLQKVGRALRYDNENPSSVAYISDIIFCEPNGKPLSSEEERYNTLRSISI